MIAITNIAEAEGKTFDDMSDDGDGDDEPPAGSFVSVAFGAHFFWSEDELASFNIDLNSFPMPGADVTYWEDDTTTITG